MRERNHVMAWNLVDRTDTDSITDAIALLQKTSTGYGDMTVKLLKNKMKKPKDDPDDPNANTNHHCLRLYNYEDDQSEKLLVSAFFFLRRRKKEGDSDPKTDWGGCLTVGAEDAGAAGGLTSDQLRDALNAVCKTVMPDAPSLEVMHLPPAPAFSPKNLQAVFTELRQNAQQNPPIEPRLEHIGMITLGYPWVPKDINGKEVLMDFMRLKIVTAP